MTTWLLFFYTTYFKNNHMENLRELVYVINQNRMSHIELLNTKKTQ